MHTEKTNKQIRQTEEVIKNPVVLHGLWRYLLTMLKYIDTHVSICSILKASYHYENVRFVEISYCLENNKTKTKLTFGLK